MKFVMRRAVLALMLLLGGGLGVNAAHAASARATLDRDTVQLDETLTLNVELEGSTSSTPPDFSVLQKDFETLGTSSSTSVSIVNGQSSSKVLWAVALQPKHEGTITIPPLSVGGASTQALTLVVKPQSASGVDPSGKPAGDVILEFSAEPRAPYVQQQVRATLKLYYAVNLTEGNLEDPHVDGVVVKKLGQDKQYQGSRNGRTYIIVERHYALTAEKSGALTLPAVNFRGRAQDANDPNSFFNRGRLIAAHSDPIQLEVRPRPADSGNSAWLPAASLSLSVDGIDGSSTMRVGEPLTLNLHLKAQGLGFEQLPELTLPPVDGADVYPDKSVTSTRDDGSWIYGQRDRKFALVPTRAGKLKLPAVEIRWWDTEHDRAEVASWPAQEITVLPAVGGATPAPATSAGAAAMPPVRNDNTPALADSVALTAAQTEAQRWRLLAAISLALWLLSAVAFVLWRWRQRSGLADAAKPAKAASHAIDDAKPRSAFRAACTRNDLDAAAHALLAWARLHRPALRNLDELRVQLDDPAQREVLAELGRARYGDGDGAGLGARLAATFAKGLSWVRADARVSAPSALPPLYPSRR